MKKKILTEKLEIHIIKIEKIKEREEIAKIMLNKKMSLEMISEITGLELEEIKNIK